MKAVLAAAALCALTASVSAPTNAQLGRADPSDPAVRGLPLETGSAFKTYLPYREDKRRSWREANDEVERLGGHPGHIGDAKPAAAAPAEPPAPVPAATPKPAADPHRHHRH